MKQALTLLISIISCLALSGQKNYALYSIDDVKPVCLTFDGRQMLGIEAVGEKSKLNLYRLDSGEIKAEYMLNLNPESIRLIISHTSKDLMYLITSKNGEEERKPYLDAIYSFDPIKNKLKKQYADKENRLCPSRVEMVNENLVLTRGFDASLLFDTEEGKLNLLTSNPDLRLFSIAPQQGGCIMVNIKEGADDVNPLYLMNDQGNLSEEVAQFDSRMVFSTNQSENRIPHLIIENPENKWVEDAYSANCFPISLFEIGTHTKWREVYASIGKEESISTLIAANETYMLAASKTKIYVYNHAQPQTDNPNIVSGEELESIKNYLNARIRYDKSKVNSTPVSIVMDASFYRIDITTKLDESSYTSDKFFAIEKNNEYSVLKDCNDLVGAISADYSLKSTESALLFEEVLDVLYPVSTFDEKNKDRYQIDNTWIFVREESFGDLRGYEVTIDDSGSVQAIKQSNELEKK